MTTQMIRCVFDGDLDDKDDEIDDDDCHDKIEYEEVNRQHIFVL